MAPFKFSLLGNKGGWRHRWHRCDKSGTRSSSTYYSGSEWTRAWQWRVTLSWHSISFLPPPCSTFTMQVVEDLATVGPGSLSSRHTFDRPASDVKCSCSAKASDPDVACDILLWWHVSLIIWIIALSTLTKISIAKKVGIPSLGGLGFRFSLLVYIFNVDIDITLFAISCQRSSFLVSHAFGFSIMLNCGMC
jgi:hypothetical protein